MSKFEWGNDWRDWRDWAGFLIAFLILVAFGTAVMVAVGWAMYSQ